MQLMAHITTAVVAATTVLALQSLWLTSDTPPVNRASAPKPAAAEPAPADILPLRLSARRVANSTQTGTSDSDDSALHRQVQRLEAKLVAVTDQLSSLERSAGDFEGREESGMHFQPGDEPLLDDEHNVHLDDHYVAVTDSHELWLQRDEPNRDVTEDVVRALHQAPGAELLSDATLMHSACSSFHCRLEFSHAGDAAQMNLETNIGLLLPAGASSAFVPLYEGDQVTGTTVFITLADAAGD